MFSSCIVYCEKSVQIHRDVMGIRYLEVATNNPLLGHPVWEILLRANQSIKIPCWIVIKIELVN